METWNILLIAFFISICDGLNFSRNQTFVKIRPRVSILDEYSFDDSPGVMSPLIQQAFTEFSNVVVPQFITENEEDNDLTIVAGVAEFNRFSQRNKNSTEAPMQVWVHYTIELDDVNDNRILQYHDILVRANLVFPGTIPVVSLSSSHPNISELLEFLHGVRDNLMAADFAANLTASPQYKITDYLPLQSCNFTENSTEDFEDVLRGIEVIILYRFPTNEEIEDGNVNEFVVNFQAEFDLCKARLENEVSADIEVFALTHWPDTSMNGFVNISNLVKFWRRMNDWAVRTKNIIILEEVFDIPTSQAPVTSTLGWYKLVENSSYKHSSEYIFEAKESLRVIESTYQPSLNTALKISNCVNNILGWRIPTYLQNNTMENSNDMHIVELMENNCTGIAQVVVVNSSDVDDSEELIAKIGSVLNFGNDSVLQGQNVTLAVFVALSKCLRKDNNFRTQIKVAAQFAKLIIVLDDTVQNAYFPVNKRELAFKIVKLDSCRDFIRRILIGMEDVHIVFKMRLPSLPLNEEYTENQVGFQSEMERIFRDGINNWACSRNVTVIVENTIE